MFGQTYCGNSVSGLNREKSIVRKKRCGVVREGMKGSCIKKQKFLSPLRACFEAIKFQIRESIAMQQNYLHKPNVARYPNFDTFSGLL